MIERLNNFKVNLISNRKNRKFNKRTIYAVELLKEESIYYNIDKKVKLGQIEYKYQDELKKIMLQVLYGIVKHLELDTTRVIFYDPQTINIEPDKKVIDFENDREILIFGFYEIDADRCLMISFEKEIIKHVRYKVFKDTLKTFKFPYSAHIDKNKIN